MRSLSKWLCLALALVLFASVALAEGEGTIHRQNVGTNATELPLVGEDDEQVTLTIWRSFTSTVMESLDECLVFQEMEERTGVKIEWITPPVGQETDNFNLRIASNDLPHMFSTPPDYAGGLDKAIEDEVYLPLNEYYDAGLTPNYKYLRENNEAIALDTILDSGYIVSWHMLDYVPSSPWSGLWVRQDWLEEQNLEIPVTIDDWTNMLRVFKEQYGSVLGFNIRDLNGWYGVGTNFNFAAAYDTGYNWLNKDGVAEYGPANDGYKEFLTQINAWYAEGLIDPDFATRNNDDYASNVANSTYGAFGMAYGEIGQAKATGMVLNETFKVLAVGQPVSYEGQETHLRQYDSIVREDKDFLTYKCVEDGIAEIAMQWKDYWYSQEGGDLCSYGVEGMSYEWDENDELVWVYQDTGLVDKGDEVDFWTIYPLFKLHNWGYLRDSTAYEMQPEVWQCIGEWGKSDASYVIPSGLTPTAEEAEEISRIETSIKTYREEMTYKFITGQESLDGFDDYVQAMKGMELDEMVELKQQVLDRYLAR